MSPNERRARLLGLGAELTTLEAKAGLTERMRQAQERCHVQDTSYYWRPIIRDAYFSVDDRELRRALITKRAQCDSEVDELRVEKLLALRQALETATLTADRLPWGWAAIVAIVAALCDTDYSTPPLPPAPTN